MIIWKLQEKEKKLETELKEVQQTIKAIQRLCDHTRADKTSALEYITTTHGGTVNRCAICQKIFEN